MAGVSGKLEGESHAQFLATVFTCANEKAHFAMQTSTNVTTICLGAGETDMEDPPALVKIIFMPIKKEILPRALAANPAVKNTSIKAGLNIQILMHIQMTKIDLHS